MKNHQEHLKWEKSSISLEVGNSHVILEKLFGNHSDIQDKTNKVINENIETIISDLQPVIQQVVSDFIFGIVNQLFSFYSVKELFFN